MSSQKIPKTLGASRSDTYRRISVAGAAPEVYPEKRLLSRAHLAADVPGQPHRLPGGDRGRTPGMVRVGDCSSRLPVYCHYNRPIPLLRLDIVGIRHTAREIDTKTALQFPVFDLPCFPDLIPGTEQVEEDRLVHLLLAQFKVIPVNRRFRAIFNRNVAPGAAGGQDVEDAVEQPARVASGSADVRLRRRKVLLDDPPQFIVNFPECQALECYL